VPLGSLLASHLGAPGCQNRAKICPKHVLKLNFVKKADFHKTIVKPLPKSTKWPKTGRYIRLRWPQDASKTILKSVFSLLNIDFDFESFRGRFWFHFGSQNASLLAPFCRSRSIQKSIRNQTALKATPRTPQEHPRFSQDTSRNPPESPRTPQDASRTPSGRLLMPFRNPSDVSKCFSAP